ncbi:hypothetical protein MK079_02245 [Candidatus Gracilibacteria bacterium]|nr:hypothetical protein [Candidatus Gracilibacteria bacterium]
MSSLLAHPVVQNIIQSFLSNLEFYTPKILMAIAILGFGSLVAIGVYRLVRYGFKKLKIDEFIARLETDTKEEKKSSKKHILKISKKIPLDEVVAKAMAYYIFLVFFRFSIVAIGIDEVEAFLQDLIAYIPNLFIAIVIGFFGVRFANFIYDITYHALKLGKQHTAKIIASGAKIIILFFTLMIVLDYTKLVDDFIINTIFVGFITTLTLASGLAFGLGGRDIAKEILESFRK